VHSGGTIVEKSSQPRDIVVRFLPKSQPMLRGSMGTLLRWITGIGTAFKKPGEQAAPASSQPPDAADETAAESAAAPVADESKEDEVAAKQVEVESRHDQPPGAGAVSAASGREVAPPEPAEAEISAAEDVEAASADLDDVAIDEPDEDEPDEDQADDEDVSLDDDDVAADEEPVVSDRAAVAGGQAPIPSGQSLFSPDQDEISRRRELIRDLFNDFWRGNDEKPVTFAGRLDLAESYVNERLSARGEPWQLDAHTRKQLGLPARVH
jgi:hypothetical protein